LRINAYVITRRAGSLPGAEQRMLDALTRVLKRKSP
jgi:hypothetical protein